MTPAALLKAAWEYVGNVPPAKNSFGVPALLSREPWEARTKCSTFVTKLAEEVFGWGPRDIRERFGRSIPYAKDFHAAVAKGEVFAPVHEAKKVRPGDCITIAFDEATMRATGFTGHVALVAATPVSDGWANVRGVEYRRWTVEILDSTSSPHGFGDSRAQRLATGIGSGTMVLVTDVRGFIKGYGWHRDATPSLNADGAKDVLIGSWREID